MLIKARLASKFELDSAYTLDEALKLYSLYRMDCDIEAAQAAGLKKNDGKGR